MFLKTALLFPGQGSHFAGMGNDLLNSGNRLFTDLLAVASDRLGYNLKDYITESPLPDFNKSANLQPLITAVSLSYWKLLQEEGIHFDVVLGHSLGEITALAGAGVVSPEDCVDIAAFRGQMMDMSSALCGGGGMAVVLFSDEDSITAAIDKYDLSSSLFVANYNASNQTVLSGLSRSLELFAEKFSEEYRAKVQRIDVAGPWHTPFISPGMEKYLEWAAKKEFSSARIHFILNGTADFADSQEDFLQRTADQLVKPVYWSRSLQTLAKVNAGGLVFEVGPGKILAGLIRANKLQKSFAAVESVNSIEMIPEAVVRFHSGIEPGGA